jgi:hypothetical protein
MVDGQRNASRQTLFGERLINKANRVAARCDLQV